MRDEELHTGLKTAQPEIGTSGGTIGWCPSVTHSEKPHDRNQDSRRRRDPSLGARKPAMAQEVIYNPGYCAQFYPNANCQNKGPGNPYTDGYQRQTYQDRAYRDRAYRDNRYWHDSYNRWNGDGRSNTGFWPGDVAAAVGGGEPYARQNGFVCTPGKRFRGEDGHMHLCR